MTRNVLHRVKARSAGNGKHLPRLITKQGTLAKEVSLEKVIHFASTLGCGLVHHSFTLLDDVKQVSRVALS